MPKQLNITQLCRAAGISRATVYRMISKNQMPAPEKVNGCALWNVRAVREALARRRRLLLA